MVTENLIPSDGLVAVMRGTDTEKESKSLDCGKAKCCFYWRSILAFCIVFPAFLQA